jgi:hypothetical protein
MRCTVRWISLVGKLIGVRDNSVEAGPIRSYSLRTGVRLRPSHREAGGYLLSANGKRIEDVTGPLTIVYRWSTLKATE